MTFKIKIARAPFEVEFETGSISEAIGALEAENTNLARLFAIDLSGGSEADEPEQAAPTVATETAPAAAAAAGKGRGRPRKNVEATAPAPIPTPDAPLAPVLPTTTQSIGPTPATVLPPNQLAPTDGLAIPPFLDRASPAAVVNQPPVPVAPPPPPAPPIGVLAQKVIAHIEKAAPDKPSQDGWVAWVASTGLTIPGATFAETIDCLRFIDDTKLAPVAAALSIA
jgi:hypothetical protein